MRDIIFTPSPLWKSPLPGGALGIDMKILAIRTSSRRSFERLLGILTDMGYCKGPVLNSSTYDMCPILLWIDSANRICANYSLPQGRYEISYETFLCGKVMPKGDILPQQNATTMREIYVRTRENNCIDIHKLAVKVENNEQRHLVTDRLEKAGLKISRSMSVVYYNGYPYIIVEAGEINDTGIPNGRTILTYDGFRQAMLEVRDNAAGYVGANIPVAQVHFCSEGKFTHIYTPGIGDMVPLNRIVINSYEATVITEIVGKFEELGYERSNNLTMIGNPAYPWFRLDVVGDINNFANKLPSLETNEWYEIPARDFLLGKFYRKMDEIPDTRWIEYKPKTSNMANQTITGWRLKKDLPSIPKDTVADKSSGDGRPNSDLWTFRNEGYSSAFSVKRMHEQPEWFEPTYKILEKEIKVGDNQTKVTIKKDLIWADGKRSLIESWLGLRAHLTGISNDTLAPSLPWPITEVTVKVGCCRVSLQDVDNIINTYNEINNETGS